MPSNTFLYITFALATSLPLHDMDASDPTPSNIHMVNVEYKKKHYMFVAYNPTCDTVGDLKNSIIRMIKQRNDIPKQDNPEMGIRCVFYGDPYPDGNTPSDDILLESLNPRSFTVIHACPIKLVPLTVKYVSYKHYYLTVSLDLTRETVGDLNTAVNFAIAYDENISEKYKSKEKARCIFAGKVYPDETLLASESFNVKSYAPILAVMPPKNQSMLTNQQENKNESWCILV
jgi:hypothetical protein